jgi:glycosyltransferase involved in cell wall biosynthesis
MKKKYKLAILETNPVHYRTPIYKKLTKHPKIDLMVYFCSDVGPKEFFVPKFGKKVKFETEMKFNRKFLRNYYPLKERFLPKGLWNFSIVKELIKNKYDAIIIYGYSSLSNKLSYIAAKLSRTPIIFREEINEMAPGRIKPFLKGIVYRRLFKIPDAFLCSYTKNKEFYQSFDVPTRKLFMHPCAVDNKLYQKLAKKTNKQKARKKLKIPKSANVFLSVGEIHQRKGLFKTLKAFEMLKDKNNYLIFLGEGSEKGKLQKYTKNKQIKNVKFFSFKSKTKELAEFYSAADVFIVASLSDPSPKTLNEAMNFSLPVIVSNKVGTAQDLVKHNKNGYMFQHRNLSELLKYMKILSDNKKLRKKMGKKSLKIVSKWNFDEDVKATLKALDYIYKNGK